VKRNDRRTELVEDVMKLEIQSGSPQLAGGAIDLNGRKSAGSGMTTLYKHRAHQEAGLRTNPPYYATSSYLSRAALSSMPPAIFHMERN
jgi:hypothetical protein